jgi:HTH-type transcriptional regulator / antitoxin HipB
MYSVQSPTQLSPYLKALRRQQGLTQAALGLRLGVTGARIAAIEHNPGSVSVGQLLQVLNLLGARMYLDERPTSSRERIHRTPGPVGEW